MRIGCGLTTDQCKQYQLFGFVILRGWLTQTETAALRDESLERLRTGHGSGLDQRPWQSGMAGHWVPMLDPAAPVSCAIVEDDRFHAAARDLLDGECLISPADTHAVLLYGESGWHTDVGFDVSTVKFAAYLDPVTRPTAALRVLPLSHCVPYKGLAPYLHHPRVETEDVPGHVCETEPGDVIVFDGRLFHATARAGDRLQWSVVYVRDVTEHRTTDANRAGLTGWYEEGPTWDGSPYPPGTTWLSPGWYHDPSPSPVKRRWLQRFDDLGIKPTAPDAM